MNSPALKAAPQVNLEEFERRLRTAASPQSAQEDPLAELARIVGIDGPPQRPNENVVSLAPRSAPIADLGLSAREPLIRVSFAESKTAAIDPPLLRPSMDDNAASAAAEARETSEGWDLFENDRFEPEGSQPQSATPPAASRGSKGRRYASVAFLSMLGVAGLGAAAALKYGAMPGLHKTPPVIMASDAPTKVAPPSTDTVAPPNDTASVLFKEQPTKAAPVKMISTEEQPVDLHTQGIDPAAPVAAAPAASTAPTAAIASPIAANPNAPLVAQGDAAAPAAAGVASPLFAEPKRVKTVSVRPDGTLIAAAQAAPADSAPATRSVPVIPAPTPDANADAGLPQPATPKLDLPLKPRAKSTARVPVGKTDTTGVADAPLQLGPPTKLEKAAKAARAKPAAPVVADPAPASIVTASVDPTTTQTAASAASAPAPAAAGAGIFSVQLAAPTSSTEAQSAANRLKAKYASELNGLEPTIHKADLAQGTVYRVRVSDLSKADAVALCEKLKASGGACFVARN
jgi:SPOR domain